MFEIGDYIYLLVYLSVNARSKLDLMLLYKYIYLSGSSIDFQSNTPEGDRPNFDLYTSKRVQSVTRGHEIKGGEIDAHFSPEWPDRLG